MPGADGGVLHRAASSSSCSSSSSSEGGVGLVWGRRGSRYGSGSYTADRDGLLDSLVQQQQGVVEIAVAIGAYIYAALYA